MIIKLNIDPIFAEVSKFTSFIGKFEENEQGPLYELIKIKDKDKAFVQASIDKGAEELIGVLSDFIIDLPEDEIVCKMPNSFKSILESKVLDLASQYLVFRCLGDWLKLTSEDNAPTYYEKAAVCLSQIHSIVYTRSKPIKRYF